MNKKREFTMGACFAKHFIYLVHFFFFFWAVFVLISNKAVYALSRKLCSVYLKCSILSFIICVDTGFIA